eukprot:1161913-Pelagomonas_calceolata.AAC.15
MSTRDHCVGLPKAISQRHMGVPGPKLFSANKDQVLILLVRGHPYVPEIWPDQDQCATTLCILSEGGFEKSACEGGAVKIWCACKVPEGGQGLQQMFGHVCLIAA